MSPSAAGRELPDFDDLPRLPGTGLRHAWDVFGREDVLGSMNLLTSDRTAAPARLVQSGQRISLDLPLDCPSPPLFGRQPFEHVVFPLNRNEMDDRVDNFHLQGSTQWDGLNHVRCREDGYWGGRLQDPPDGPNGLGVHHWAEHGIAGRGVLIDVATWLASQGEYEPLGRRPITVDCAGPAKGCSHVGPTPGVMVCVRTGWSQGYLALSTDERVSYAGAPTFSGLHASEDMARFLWNAHPAAICCDNPAIEVVPGDPAVGSLHRRLLPTLGMALGEMFDFETLAPVCRAADRWTFFFVAAPLRIPNALGSPGNAVAIL